jgi:hypothetical protein
MENKCKNFQLIWRANVLMIRATLEDAGTEPCDPGSNEGLTRGIYSRPKIFFIEATISVIVPV